MAAIKGADLFVLNSAYEGFSHQLLEVMSLGVPIVTTDIGGNPELIENEKDGLLVPYDDYDALFKAVKRMLTNETLRNEVTEMAQKRVATFSLQRMIAETEELFNGYKK